MFENLVLRIPKVKQIKDNLEIMRGQISNMQFFNEKLREKINNLEELNINLNNKLQKKKKSLCTY